MAVGGPQAEVAQLLAVKWMNKQSGGTALTFQSAGDGNLSIDVKGCQIVPVVKFTAKSPQTINLVKMATKAISTDSVVSELTHLRKSSK